MSHPWMKFYPSDWRADAALRMCSIAARGLWMEMLCVMHKSEPRGSLMVNSVPLSIKQLATLAGIPLGEAEELLGELEASGVFSRDDNGTIYSRRIRRDEERAAVDRENGKAGGNPSLKAVVNPPVNGEDNGEDKAQKLEARSQRLERKIPRAERANVWPKNFEEIFWKEYPKRVEKQETMKVLRQIYKADKVSWDLLLSAVRLYAKSKADTEPQWIKNPPVWLRRGCWDDELPSSPTIFAVVQSEGETPRGGYYAMQGSPEFEAWNKHRLATEGRTYPAGREGGWEFKSRWPPDHTPPHSSDADAA
jgi:hypothetical protein